MLSALRSFAWDRILSRKLRDRRLAAPCHQGLRIERLEDRSMLAAGDLDLTFGTGGLATAPPFGGSNDDFIVDAIKQTDGKIVALGGSLDLGLGASSVALARYNVDGSLDATFGVGGRVILPLPGDAAGTGALALQLDGKIIAAGAIDGDIVVARFNTDGSLDLSFSSDGIVTTDLGLEETVHGVAVLAGGKIAVAGTRRSLTTGASAAFVVQYTPIGTLDTSFSGDGILIGLGAEGAFGAGATPAGLLVVGLDTGTNVAVAQLEPDGSFDLDFDVDGTATADFSTDAVGNSLTVAPGGDIVISASIDGPGSEFNLALARFDADGALDLTFDTDGLLETTIEAIDSDVVAYADGRIAASIVPGTGLLDGDFVVARFEATGALDAAFSTDGIASADFGSGGQSDAIVLLDDGRLIAAGTFFSAISDDFALVAFGAGGAVDTTFGALGLVVTDFAGTTIALGREVLVQADGKVLVVGTNVDRILITRFNADGTLDVTYGSGGVVNIDIGLVSTAEGAVLQSDGRLVVVGSTSDVGGNEAFVARFTTSGALDATFSGDGVAIVPDGVVDIDSLNAVDIQADGKIVAAGEHTGGILLVRFEADGDLDTTFEGDGIVFVPTGAGTDANDVLVLAGGKILVVGDQTNTMSLAARYNADGTLDTTFSGDGVAAFTIAALGEELLAAAEQSDGKVVVVGRSFVSGDEVISVARLNLDGSLDTTFSGDGSLVIDLGEDNTEATGVEIAADGKIVIVGTAGSPLLGDPTGFVVVRLTSAGALDATFSGDGILQPPFGIFAQAAGVALDSTGRIVVGGDVDGRLAAARILVDAGVVLEPDTIGGYDSASGFFFLRNTNTPGPASLTFQFGAGGAGLIPLDGDWDGSGDDTIGVYDPSTGAFFLRNSNSGGAADIVFTFGAGGAGLAPIVGDWDGDGDDTIGVYDPSTGAFFQRNTNSAGAADIVFTFGAGGAGILPVIGDYDGNGTSTAGIYGETTGTFFLRNANSAGAADLAFTFGPGGAGWDPLIGDYDGDGDDTVGAYDPSSAFYFLRNSNTAGAADVTVGYGPVSASWIPLVGNWTFPGGLGAFAATGGGLETQTSPETHDALRDAFDEISDALTDQLPLLAAHRDRLFDLMHDAEHALEDALDHLSAEDRERIFSGLAEARDEAAEDLDRIADAHQAAIDEIISELEHAFDRIAA